jgi:hypothetical protein
MVSMGTDRFVPRDHTIFSVTARSAATWQSVDRFVPRDDIFLHVHRRVAFKPQRQS